MRSLTKEECKAIEKAVAKRFKTEKTRDKYAERMQDSQVEFYPQGNFTICILYDSARIIVGATKRHCGMDVPDELRGQQIAFGRAIDNWLDIFVPNTRRKRHAK